MFPGRFPLSDEPLSSDGIPQQNGDVLSKSFIIDQVYPTDESIDKQRTVELVVDLESDFGVYNIDKEVTLELSVDIKSNFSLTN